MIKTFFFAFLSFAFSFNQAFALPKIINFEKLHKDKYEELFRKLGCSPFNNAPEIIPIFIYLREEYQIEAAVETGTYLGNTSRTFSHIFPEVHTIEINENLFNQAKKRLKNKKNITCHLGSSERILKDILPSLSKKRVLFYLDAHWKSFWPLLNELEEISKTHQDNCIIVIDDFKVPGRKDIPYDSYNSDECSYKYIKSHLTKIFSSYSHHFLIPKSIDSRAKFIAIPRTWINRDE